MPFDIEAEDRRTVIKQKLRKYFDGKIVRKDLTKKIKEGANVPVYVLEFLLGQSTDFCEEVSSVLSDWNMIVILIMTAE